LFNKIRSYVYGSRYEKSQSIILTAPLLSLLALLLNGKIVSRYQALDKLNGAGWHSDGLLIKSIEVDDAITSP
ncbi:MAG: hypothetical protein Q9N62_01550, partial [Ghiorsea sp.]|nr:hypothetical protein [Ghiorsea sp.]